MPQLASDRRVRKRRVLSAARRVVNGSIRSLRARGGRGRIARRHVNAVSGTRGATARRSSTSAGTGRSREVGGAVLAGWRNAWERQGEQARPEGGGQRGPYQE
jgi:hypothetical protein